MSQALKARSIRGLAWLLVAAALAVACGPARAQTDASEKNWPSLRETLFGTRPILDGAAMLSLEAPVRAEDAALVPVAITDLQPGRIKALTLVVDENPAPVAAVFTLSPEARVRFLETRLRVNAYSYIRAIAETEDGALYMVKRYVKASGGCSAPASKNADEALASLGELRLRQFPATDPASEEAELQLQIRHPNLTGMQMDQVTGLYRPAHFVQTIRLSADGKPLMSVEGAISLSENPSLRFKYRPGGAKALAAHVEDTEGKVFEKSWEREGKRDKDS
ncbi:MULTISPECIES: quinoprotein dehydrogenase-associated SoxYZ-like carrier [Rhodomicrobium]|uniref:quinoprotein dehydrogenase-associated SoxYZ-like carrier n=1 Tax=Rhodomicrobium TaxID=1068 RepID=UPI000B4BB0CC|nr:MULTISPECIES: quinoprotein dehydrogenase-associated SoxYZ-like carrier [Rhodomicrobium]